MAGCKTPSCVAPKIIDDTSADVINLTYLLHPECKSYKYPNKIFLYTISSNIGPVNTMTNTENKVFFNKYTVNIVFLLFLTTPKMFVKKFLSTNKNITVKIKITIENKKLSFNPFFEEASIELNFPLYTYLDINNTDKIIKIYPNPSNKIPSKK